MSERWARPAGGFRQIKLALAALTLVAGAITQAAEPDAADVQREFLAGN